jgi:hypothetical protein
MRTYWHWFALSALVVITIMTRILIAYQSENFQYEAYFAIRQAEHIQETGLPLYADPLSYQGRMVLFPPFFYYLVALASALFGMVLTVKVGMAILAAMTVILMFLVVQLLTGKKGIALLCAACAGFTPAFFSLTVNNLSVYSLAMPLFLLAVYLLFIVRQRRVVFFLFCVLFLLVLTHPIVSVFILGLLIMLLLMKLEGFRIESQDYELLLFVTFLVMWITFMLYKKAFLFHGISVIWQNLPANLLASFFQELSYVQIVSLVGFIPFFFGVIGIYHVLFRQKKKSYLYVVSFSIAFFMLLFFKLLPLEAGLAFLSSFFIIMAGCTLSELSDYFSKTRFSWLRIPFFFVIGLVFLFTSAAETLSLGASASAHAPSAGDVRALEYVHSVATANETLLASIEEGFAVTAIAGTKNVADENFLLIPEVDVRYDDMKTIFTLRFETGALRLLGKYDVDYVFFSDHYFRSGQVPAYFADERCFELVYNESQKIYRSRCRLQ